MDGVYAVWCKFGMGVSMEWGRGAYNVIDMTDASDKVPLKISIYWWLMCIIFTFH